MHFLQTLWPQAFQIKKKDVKSLIVQLIILLVVSLVAGLIFGILGKIILIGFIFKILGGLIDIYCFIGFLLSIFKFAGLFD